MKEYEANEFYRGHDRLNCVQAVLKAFQSETKMSDEDMAGGASLGGGRAEGGVCGALHAARMLVNDSEKLLEIERLFEASAGSLQCKKIKKLKKISCRDCVGLAARFIEKNMDAPQG